eukprot:scaffold1518_cov417-Prasinococcus_capsulatus_cf.AAC.44
MSVGAPDPASGEQQQQHVRASFAARAAGAPRSRGGPQPGPPHAVGRHRGTGSSLTNAWHQPATPAHARRAPGC